MTAAMLLHPCLLIRSESSSAVPDVQPMIRMTIHGCYISISHFHRMSLNVYYKAYGHHLFNAHNDLAHQVREPTQQEHAAIQ